MSAERRNSTSRVSMRRGSKSRTPVAQSTVNIKCVALGDGDVGKSTMLLTFLCGHYPSDVPPGPMDGHAEFDHLTREPYTITVDTTEVKMSLIDTYGQDEYEKLRERTCTSADVYILCYDISRPSSFERLEHQWLPEIRRYGAPDTPFIVAGLKSDIRTAEAAAAAAANANPDDTSASGGSAANSCVSYSLAIKQAQAMGAAHYVECASKTSPSTVKRVLEKAAQAAAMAAINNSDLKRSSCSVS